MKTKNLILTAITSIGLATATFAQVPNYVPTNGLVGWWPFNGNSNDFSTNANNGTVTGATLTTDRFGNVNSAYNFNGVSDFINVNNNSSLNPTTQISISLWLKTDSSNYNAGLIGKWNNGISNAEQYAITANNNSNSLCFHVKTNSTGQINVCDNPTSYNDNQWHNIIGVWDGAKSKIYYDGQLVDSSNCSGSILSQTQNFEIGRYAGGQATSIGTNNNYFNGILDDIGAWNRALTSQEITALYNGNICYQYITVTDTLIINTNITGFNPVTYQNTIKVWPNPTHDHITIDNGNIANLTGYQIKITNSLSQQVFQSAITQQQFYVDLSTWTGNGIYFVHIIDGQGNTIDIKKIVLQ